MAAPINSKTIAGLTRELEAHPIYAAVQSVEDLQCFMEHHVYSVWDFMSLLKYLQSTIVPASFPWTPGSDGDLGRFINEIVLEEETDQTNIPGEYASHFELYQRAMLEIGARVTDSTAFVQLACSRGIQVALREADIPEPSRTFTRRTFRFIDSNRPHEVAAAFALGREHIVPAMFQSILDRSGIAEAQAPTFHYYLKRHIHLDDGIHAPLSIKLLNRLCDGDDKKIEQATEAARAAVKARIELWDGVLEAIEARRDEAQRAA